MEFSDSTPSFQDGDLGIGYALLRAGQVFGKTNFGNKGEQILIRCAHVFLDKNNFVPDSGMLNGASGGGLVFEKAYNLTNNHLFNQTAESCFGNTLKFGVKEGISIDAKQDLSFMDGLAGTGAGLIKAMNRDGIDFSELLWLI